MQTLRLFAEVARLQSFSQAAKLHGITQSAASQRIQSLEGRLGVTLFDRSVRPLRVTDAGRVYLIGAEDVLARLDRLEAKVRALRSDPEGAVRVAAIYSAGIELLDAVRERFEREHPRAAIRICYEKPEGVYEAVREGSADLGILSYPQRWKKVNVLPLRDETMCVVCRPDHPLAKRERVSPRDLTPYEMAGFDLDLPVGRRTAAYLKEHGGEPRVTLRFDNLDTIKGMVAVTDRCAILPRRTVRREVEAGGLSAVEMMPRLVRPMGIVHRGGSGGASLSPVAGAFAQALVRHAGPEVEGVEDVKDGGSKQRATSSVAIGAESS